MTLPNFLVIGAYKSGTTSLHHYLSQHPEVFLPQVKEPNYFAFANTPESSHPAYPASVKTYPEYERLFVGAEGAKAIGEVSPEYMTTSASARIIFDTVPSVRIIAILRNPIERAYSDYLMYRRDGRETEADFSQALNLQDERFENGEPTGYYIRTGYYAAQLKAYYTLFSPRQIKIILFEDLITEPLTTLRELFEFLEVNPDFVPDRLEVYNRSGIPGNQGLRALTSRRVQRFLKPLLPSSLRPIVRRWVENSLTKPPMSSAARRMLLESYREDIFALQALIGRDLAHWLTL